MTKQLCHCRTYAPHHDCPRSPPMTPLSASDGPAEREQSRKNAGSSPSDLWSFMLI